MTLPSPCNGREPVRSALRAGEFNGIEGCLLRESAPCILSDYLERITEI